MKKVKKCIIPAAGMGTRFLPATKALPKEMFPIVDKPVMQYLVEEAVAAGCEDIIIVTGRNKRAIEDHFDANFELEKTLEDRNKFDFLEKVKSLNSMANISYVRQPYPKGDGDAILRAKSFIGNEPFLVLFWDDIIDHPQSGAEQLIEVYERRNSSVISTVEVGEDEVSAYGIIETEDKNEDVFAVSKFLEKPDASDTTSRRGVIGKYVVTPDIFHYLEKASEGKITGEIRLADAFELMRQEQDIYGVKIQWTRFDTGSKIGYLQAVISYGLRDRHLGDDLKKFIQSIN